MSRPISLVEAFAAASGVGVAFALLNRAWPSLKTFLATIDLSSLSSAQWALVIAFGVAVLVIAPLAMYLVLSDE